MLLSISFFGSPRTLVKYCRDGMSDFLEMPQEGWHDGGLFGSAKGVANGTLSLTKNVGVGFIQSFTVLNLSLAQMLLHVS